MAGKISQQIIDTAFSQARKKGSQMKSVGSHKKQRADKAINRVKIFSNYAISALRTLSRGFPSIDRMSEFHRELLLTFVDLGKTRKTLAHVEGTAKAVSQLAARAIKSLARASNENAMKKLSSQFFGRSCSFIENAEESILYIKAAQRELSQFPKISADLPTVILAGYPNSGKTTILKRLTGSSPEIAPYPFTTQQINIGKFTERHREVQVIDTPGLLDRPMSERNPIERRAVSALRHLKGLIVFIIDPTEGGGYPLEKQLHLLEEVKKEFGKDVILVANKADISSVAEIANVPEEKILEGESMRSELKQKILEKLRAGP